MLIPSVFFVVYTLLGVTSPGLAQLRPPRIIEHPNNVVVKKQEPATLDCKADGKPTPTIEWYKDSEIVQNTANRMVLPSGSLFFLHVIHNKRDGDTGTYWCLAKNEVGRTKSRNATLEVALLRDEFKVMPKNIRVASGETAVMDCAPPKGFPEPNISWKHNGNRVNTGSGRFRIVNTGNLMISDVRKSDEGAYTCVAENMVGVRESPPAHISVQVKPYFIRGPEDVTALSDESVEFHCKVGGDPTPTITWKRQDGKMPIARAQILEDKALRIRHVNPSDEGVYICEVENPVGTITSSATLIVHSRPSFSTTPKDVRVPIGGVAKLECVATGNPPPSVFWTREGNQVLMFPGKTHGRFSVSAQGTLSISGVRKEDRGYYVCSALSVVGSTIAKAQLIISAAADSPPPIIKSGPANQTLPLQTAAMLPCECQSMSSSQPTIKWMVNNKPVPLHDPRFVVLGTGTLQIDDLQTSDSGIYTCVASNEGGETSWSASLTVESPRNPNINFHRMPDPTAFPAAPSKPTLVNTTETSVTLTWKRINKHSSSHIIGYTIEGYSNDVTGGWTVVGRRIKHEIYTVNNLRPDSKYLFYVRAENSFGLGAPSQLSDEIRTLSSSSSFSLPDYDLDQARTRLASCSIELKEVRAMSSTSVKLFWETFGPQEFIEGFYVRYRDMTSGDATQKFNMMTLQNTGSSYLLSDLNKYTEYEIFMVPFYKSVEGPPSNTRTVHTLEDVPSAYPDNFNVKLINLTAATLSWSGLASHQVNGKLLGYNIQLYGNGSALHSNVTTNATTTSISLYNLTAFAVYSARILAFTQLGSGPFSAPISIRMEPEFINSYDDQGLTTNTLNNSYFDGVSKERWFIIVVVVILIFTAVLAVIFVLLLRRRMTCKKSVSTHLTVPLNKSDEIGRNGFNGNAREALWINQGWRPNDKNPNTTKLINNCSSDINNGYSSAFVAEYFSVNAPDYAEVDTHNLTTFYKKDYPSSVPAPYATTTLINAQSKYNGSVRDHRSSGSEEMANRKPDKSQLMCDPNDDGAMEHLLASEHQPKSPSDSGSYTTDEYGMPIRKAKHKNRPATTFRSAVGNPKASVVNWGDLVPPPPENPPSECGTPPETPNVTSRNTGNRLIRVQLPPLSYIHSGGRSPLVTRSYQPSPVNSRHSSSSTRSTMAKGKLLEGKTSSADPSSAADHRPHLPSLFQRFRVNHGPHNTRNTHYAPSNLTPHIVTNPLMDRGIQSSLPSLMDDGQNPAKNKVNVGSYQRLEVDSDVDCGRDNFNLKKRQSPTSSAGDGTDYARCDRGDGSASDGSHTSSEEDPDDSNYYAEADFSNCPSQNHNPNPGFTFNESNFVIEPQQQQHPARRFRHHQRANAPNFRSTSPYSTDSNMSSFGLANHRHPPKFRRKHVGDKPQHQQLPSPSSGSEHMAYENIIQSEFAAQQQLKSVKVPVSMQNGISHDFSTSNHPTYNKPIFPSISKKPPTNSDKNQSNISSPSNEFSFKSFAFRLDDRDSSVV